MGGHVGDEWVIGQRVSVARLGEVDVVRLHGEVDLTATEPIAAEVARHTAGSDAALIDLTAVTFLDSAGVRLLDAMVGGFEERGAPVRLVVPATGAARMALTLCAFPEELMFTDQSAAARSLRP